MGIICHTGEIERAVATKMHDVAVVNYHQGVQVARNALARLACAAGIRQGNRRVYTAAGLEALIEAEIRALPCAD